jgi:D-arabinose 1-dehydrogenase-like Zn-dependent alcohol dehydrogenase
VVSRDQIAILVLDYALDLMLCMTNDVIHWDSIMVALKMRGKLDLLGYQDTALNSTDMVAHELSITGWLIGIPKMMRDMLEFARENNNQPINVLIPISQVYQAIELVRQKKSVIALSWLMTVEV